MSRCFTCWIGNVRGHPTDAWVWLPKRNVLFTGDLVYVGRIPGVLPWSSVKKGQQAFVEFEAQ